MSRIFADYAPLYAAAGFAVIPTSGDGGKVPMVRGFNKWTAPPPPEKLRSWAENPRFANANIGLLLSLSRLVVVDIDDPADKEEALSRFGVTDAWQFTPRGGMHLFYRARGDERATDLRKRGLTIDLKAGPGAYVLVEPSVRPDTGKAYAARSSLIELLSDHLPFTEEGSWPTRGDQQSAELAESATGVREGARNKYLFDRGRSLAVACNSLEQLQRELQALNEENCDPPADETEVAKIARSVWGYKSRGTLMVAGGGRDRGYVLKNEMDALAGHPAAVHLLVYLRAHHSVEHVFAVAPKGLAPTLQLDHRTVRKARDALLGAGILRRTYRGGAGQKDPSRYSFAAAP